jgi:hypothetical protein
MADQDKLTTEDVAEQLGVSHETVKGWRAREQGPNYYRIGGRIFYRQKAIDLYLSESEVKH